ncbi:MAG: CBS domain-containing protein [Actinomycetota bacterium]|nr:CBS domain-containing protein [Actinomycetota bacterium]
MLAKNAMNRNPPKIHDKATIKEAAEMMALTQAGELVVVEANGRVSGMVGADEILRYLIPEYDEILARGGYPSRLTPQRRSTDTLPRMKVRQLMRIVETPLDPEQTLESALGMLLKEGGRPLPVISGGKLVGSLSTADIARSLMWRDRVSPSSLRPLEERRKDI